MVSASTSHEARERGAYLESLAHQIATPLTPLAGYLELLDSGQLGPLDPRQRPVVDALVRACARISAGVDALSEYAAIEAGHYRLEGTEIDLTALVRARIDERGAEWRRRRLAVQARLPGRLPVRGDLRLLGVALDRLIDHAIEVSPHGGRVLIRADSAEGRAVLEMFDQGAVLGVDPESAASDPVPRADVATRTGLAMALVRRIAELHGGQGILESPPSVPPEAPEAYPGCRAGFWIPAV